MTKKKQGQVKQSLLVGALASSFGVFISKVLGLLYYSPLSSLAGEGNMAFYSITYTYYDLLLKISSAGIPFAIAALVAKYVAREDYKTALVVKKLGISIVMGISFLSAIVFIFSSSKKHPARKRFVLPVHKQRAYRGASVPIYRQLPGFACRRKHWRNGHFNRFPCKPYNTSGILRPLS